MVLARAVLARRVSSGIIGEEGDPVESMGREGNPVESILHQAIQIFIVILRPTGHAVATWHRTVVHRDDIRGVAGRIMAFEEHGGIGDGQQSALGGDPLAITVLQRRRHRSAVAPKNRIDHIPGTLCSFCTDGRGGLRARSRRRVSVGGSHCSAVG